MKQYEQLNTTHILSYISKVSQSQTKFFSRIRKVYACSHFVWLTCCGGGCWIYCSWGGGREICGGGWEVDRAEVCWGGGIPSWGGGTEIICPRPVKPGAIFFSCFLHVRNVYGDSYLPTEDLYRVYLNY